MIVFDAEERSDGTEAHQKLVKQIITLACPHINIEN